MLLKRLYTRYWLLRYIRLIQVDLFQKHNLTMKNKIFVIFITCQKHDILLCDITKKNSGWQNTQLNRVVISEYTNMVKSCSAPNCQNRGKKDCVTSLYRIPRNKDQKRRWLTFLCRKTLPNVEHMYVCGEHFVTGKYIIYHKTVFHFPLLLENLQHSL